MKSIKHLANIKIHDLYETPPDLLREAYLKYGIYPELDVACNHKNYKCDHYLSETFDSLCRDWNMDFFMNPPYSKVEKFMKKAYYEHKAYNVNALILVYAKTDTKWWHSYVENKAEVHFIKGRIKFFLNGYETKNSAPYPSCWIIYRKKISRLERTTELNKKKKSFHHCQKKLNQNQL